MGLSAGPLSRYSRRRPSSRTSTAPTSRSTRRCLDTCGWASPSSRTRSFTGRSPPARTSRISRRRGSATALKASAVVAARAMVRSYTDIGICQAARTPSRPARRWLAGRARHGGSRTGRGVVRRVDRELAHDETGEEEEPRFDGLAVGDAHGHRPATPALAVEDDELLVAVYQRVVLAPVAGGAKRELASCPLERPT